MSDNKNTAAIGKPSFFDRVLASDAARRGISGAVAGLLVALVSEVVWPSSGE